MGELEKKILFGSNLLSLDQLQKENFPLKEEVLSFLKEYLSDNPLFEVHTSGSTSQPKKIMLRKSHMRNSALGTLKHLGINKGDKILLAISPSHIGGIMVLVRWIEGDLDLYTTEVKSVPELESLPQADLCSLIPLQLKNAIPHLAKLQKIIVGGGPVDKELHTLLRDSPAEIYHSYGMTETISHVALRKISGDHPDPFFRCLPGVDISTDERKCLIINAPHIGVTDLRTNDIVEIIERKGFIWKGRIDNVVNSGGIKLYPEILEEKIGELPFVYFLGGMPDEKWGEKLVMVVQGNIPFMEEDVIGYFANLHPYEIPKEIITVNEFIYTPTGKLIRNQTLQKALGA